MKVDLAKNPALADAALVHSTEAYNELLLLEQRADAHDDLVKALRDAQAMLRELGVSEDDPAMEKIARLVTDDTIATLRAEVRKVGVQ